MAEVLGIHRPTTTEFEAAYIVTDDETRAYVEKVNIANVALVDANYSIAIILQGELAAAGAALAWNVKVPSGAHRQIKIGIPLNDFGESFMVRSSVASALTFTLIGEE
jgi:hypothetical protein